VQLPTVIANRRTVGVRGGHRDPFPKIVEDLSDWLAALILGGARLDTSVTHRSRTAVRRGEAVKVVAGE